MSDAAPPASSVVGLRHYVTVTAAYWAFTLTDGALRMLVLLHFNARGYTPVQLAFLFLLYEVCGIVTNLVGGWLASRTGVRLTLVLGLGLQVVALLALAGFDDRWRAVVAVGYVMACQALSGIAKDLTKMSAKSAIKVLVPAHDEAGLFRWVAVLTGSKNALKGAGFFLGGALLALAGFGGALLAMAAGVAAVLVGVVALLPAHIGRTRRKAPLSGVWSQSAAINRLSVARMALVAARDAWFVVSVPVFLVSALGWTSAGVGAFMAVWVVGYGVVQGSSPVLLRRIAGAAVPAPATAGLLALGLAAVTALIPIGLTLGWPAGPVMLGGLACFGVVFALNASVHSFLVLAYSDRDEVALNVGFYYMANAAGRLVGTLLSGVLYQQGGVSASLWGAVALAGAAGVLGLTLPAVTAAGASWSSTTADE